MVAACDVCGKEFPTEWKKNRHRQTHDREKKCEQCQKVFKNQRNMDVHKCGSKLECVQCGKKYKNAKCLSVHQKAMHAGRLELCQRCGLVFESKILLALHIKNVHSVKKKKCLWCEKRFNSYENLNRHITYDHKSVPKRACNHCGQFFNKIASLKKHIKRHTLEERKSLFSCYHCRKRFGTQVARNAHQKHCGLERPSTSRQSGGAVSSDGEHHQETSYNDEEWQTEEAMRGDATLFTLPVSDQNLSVALIENRPRLLRQLEQQLEKRRGLKWWLTVRVKMSREKVDGQEEQDKVLVSQLHSTFHSSSLEEQTEQATLEVYNCLDKLSMEGSDWVFRDIDYIQLGVATLTPLEGTSYLPLPAFLKHSKKSLVNIKNRDQECFKWCILAKLFPAPDHSYRVSHYEDLEETGLNWGRLKFPIGIHDIRRFEVMNQHISVSVYGEENTTIFPLRVPKEMRAHHVDLLLLARDEKKHYVLIQNLDRFLSSLSKHKCRKFYCRFCLHRFTHEKSRGIHEEECAEHPPQKTRLPSPKTFIEYKRFKSEIAIPFSIFYDFECILSKSDEKRGYTHRHVPHCYSLVVVGPRGELIEGPIVHHAPHGVAKHFVDTVLELEERLHARRKKHPIYMTAMDEARHRAATECHLCKKPFTPDNPKVQDHDHYQDTYRWDGSRMSNFVGSAHVECNLKRRRSYMTPIIAHAAMKYDHNLVWEGIENNVNVKNKNIKILPKTLETYRSFSIFLGERGERELRFLDSLQHVNAPLGKLVENMDSSQFKTLAQVYPDPEDRKHLLQKGIFPHSLVENYEQMLEITSLPPKTDFYSDISQSEVSEESYAAAQQAWTHFKCQNLVDYWAIYNITDSLLLAEVMREYRTSYLSWVGLDPLHYYSGPGVAWDAALKFSRVRIELMSDAEMWSFVEKMVRGGYCGASHRWSKSNVMGAPGYDPSLPLSDILYADCINLYGWALMQNLPVGSFKWLSPEEYPSLDALRSDSGFGYLIEVSAEYDPKYEERDDGYPMMPHHSVVTEEQLSPAQRQLKLDLGLKSENKIKKLMCTFYPKEKYVIHSETLKYYVSKGLIVTKWHRVLRYEQTPIFQSFVRECIERRKQATTKQERDSWKLKINCLFGKQLRSPRHDVNVEIVRDDKIFRKRVANPRFQGFRIFAPDLVAVHMQKTVLELNTPIAGAGVILDRAKMRMYQFYHEIMEHFKDKCTFLYTDTDSAAFHITTPNLHAELEPIKHLFDFSNFNPSHPLYSTIHQKEPGYFLIEYGEQKLLRFAAISAKNYIFEILREDGGVEYSKRCKGVQKGALSKHIGIKDYEDCLFENVQKCVELNRIGSNGKHRLFSIKYMKKALINFDNKRYLCEDLITTKAFGSTIPGRPAHRPTRPANRQ